MLGLWTLLGVIVGYTLGDWFNARRFAALMRHFTTEIANTAPPTTAELRG